MKIFKDELDLDCERFNNRRRQLLNGYDYHLNVAHAVMFGCELNKDLLKDGVIFTVNLVPLIHLFISLPIFSSIFP